MRCIYLSTESTCLHGKGLPTARVGTAKWLLALMVSQNMTLQVEGTCELFVTTFLRARKHSLLSRVNMQLMLAQEPSVVKRLLAVATWQLDWERRQYGYKFVIQQLMKRNENCARSYLCALFCASGILSMFSPRKDIHLFHKGNL